MKLFKRLWPFLKNKLSRINNFILGIRLRERMLLVFIVGGILPLLFLNIYTYRSIRLASIEQAKQAETEELRVQAESLMQSMSIIESVSKNLYFDKEIEHIATYKYENYQEILKDYGEYTVISDYLSNYYQEISSITVYTYNTTLSDNEYFAYADAEIKSSRWYINAVDLKGAPYWYSSYNTLTKKNNVCMARALYTEDLELIGVVSISMQNKRSELLVSERSNNTMLFYDDYLLLHSNCDTDDSDEIMSLLIAEKEDTGSKKVTLDGESCLLTYYRVYPEYSDRYYDFVMLQSYSEINLFATTTALKNVVPSLTCVIVAILILYAFSNSFSVRINQFKEKMHAVATGDFSPVKGIYGDDEVSDLYLDLNSMIYDIQKLMDRVVSEEVAKEQLNARQKEVEFKMLASQINPHFLYNTLETIRMEALVNNQPDIEELAKMLAKIMRHNIQVGETLQPVNGELLQVEYYLKIQDYRFRDRISYKIAVDREKTENLKIMPLVIQPYVENAYVHGLEGKEEGGLILIKVEVNDYLWVEISDNGCGMNEEELERARRYLNDFDNIDRTHIGIANVNQRIKLSYGNNYGVTIESTLGQGTRVIIKLPIIEAGV